MFYSEANTINNILTNVVKDDDKIDTKIIINQKKIYSLLDITSIDPLENGITLSLKKLRSVLYAFIGTFYETIDKYYLNTHSAYCAYGLFAIHYIIDQNGYNDYILNNIKGSFIVSPPEHTPFKISDFFVSDIEKVEVFAITQVKEHYDKVKYLLGVLENFGKQIDMNMYMRKNENIIKSINIFFGINQ